MVFYLKLLLLAEGVNNKASFSSSLSLISNFSMAASNKLSKRKYPGYFFFITLNGEELPLFSFFLLISRFIRSLINLFTIILYPLSYCNKFFLTFVTFDFPTPIKIAISSADNKLLKKKRTSFLSFK